MTRVGDGGVVVKCGGCGKLLDEPSDIHASERAACPSCGSTVRGIEVKAAESFSMHDKIGLKARDLKRKKPFLEVISGDDLHRKSGVWMKIDRVIDRARNWYREMVVDPRTGKVVHHCEEPLTQHHGHGSARLKENAGVSAYRQTKTQESEDSMASDLRYPIGKFQWEENLNDERRRVLIDQIAETPAKLRAAVMGLNEKQLETPYREGGWTVQQVVHHLADSHMNAYVRFKLALTEKEPTIKPYDQERWAETADARTLPPEVSLTLLDSLHGRWVTLLRSMTKQDFLRILRHPELGTVTLERYLGLYAWHGRHHTAHITELKQRMGWK